MRIILHVWRQRNAGEKGRLVRYEVPNVSHEMSFLEMLDVVNEDLIARRASEPYCLRPRLPRRHLRHVRHDDQRGGARAGEKGTTVCQLHMRHFKDGDEIYLEPWRARAFPLVRDLVVDRTALDRIIAAGGYISVLHRQRAGRQRDPGAQGGVGPLAMDAAACIGCGACVAMCPNASAALFTGAKIDPPRPAPAGAARARPAEPSPWWRRCQRRDVSATAPTSASAKRCARRRSSWR